jgi:carboxymethylenebutenolidase
MLIHEWWGLNDQIKSVAAALAEEGYLALAIDLYDGRSTDQRDEARSLTQQVDPAVATETVAGWLRWLGSHPDSTGMVGTVGWCFGGGWSLTASVAEPVNATVIYYGRVTAGEEELRRLRGPVLGHFATRDGFIDAEMVGGFEQRMAAVGKRLETHWYEADHGFANPTSARYDADDAAVAWERTLAFFDANLGGFRLLLDDGAHYQG